MQTVLNIMQTGGSNKRIYHWLATSQLMLDLSLKVCKLSLKISFSVEEMDDIFTSGIRLLLSIGSYEIWMTDINNENMS